MEESTTLRREREKAQEKGRRAGLIEDVVDSETMSELRSISDPDE